MKSSRSHIVCKSFLEEEKRISKIVGAKHAQLEKFEIDDDGYRIEIIVPKNNVTLTDICNVVDEIDFDGYLVNDYIYQKNGIEAVLIPINKVTMNNFVWNYVEMYLTEHDSITALSMAIGVLEHMVENLSQEVKAECECYIREVFT